MNKNELLKRIEALEALSGVEKKKDLEIGKWYFIENHKCIGRTQNALIYLKEFKGDNNTNYGINSLGDWTNIFYTDNLSNMGTITEATPQEVEESLIKEAKRRGYKTGCMVKSFVSGITPIEYSEIHYRFDSNILVMGGAWIFKDGQWAEVIKNDDKPKIGDVVKAWDFDENVFVIGILVDIDDSDLAYNVNNADWYCNAKKLTPDDVTTLLFKGNGAK